MTAVCPGTIEIVPPPALDCNVKLWLPPVVVRFTAIELVVVPLVPVTVNDAFCRLLMLDAVWTDKLVPVVELVGVKLQVAPAGRLEQLKSTVPVKPPAALMVMVVLLLAEPIAAVNDVVPGESVKLGLFTKVCQAVARLAASTDPKPVARLKLVVASVLEPRNPSRPDAGHSSGCAKGAGVLGTQYTWLLLSVMGWNAPFEESEAKA